MTDKQKRTGEDGKMKKAIYPGSFDPVTYGHIDVIRRGSKMFDEVTVCVLYNRAKTSSLFSVEERVKMLQDVTCEIPNVRVDAYSGLLKDYAEKIDAHVSIRGLRAVTDFEYELQSAQINRLLSADRLDTIFLTTSLQYAYLSSSNVKEIASFGGDISACVPPEVEKMVRAKYEHAVQQP